MSFKEDTLVSLYILPLPQLHLSASMQSQITQQELSSQEKIGQEN